MATITPANLSYKDKDGDLGEVKSLTDTDVTLLNNALQDIEDLKLAYSPGFVKRDLSNLTDDGKIAISHNAMPSSNIYDDLTLGASGSTYTAPADGYLCFTKYAAAIGLGIRLYNTTNGAQVADHAADIHDLLSVFLPVQKGQTISIDYSAAGAVTLLRFIYAVGSESEKA